MNPLQTIGEMQVTIQRQAKRIEELEKERRIDAIERATEKPCGWFGYYEGKVCTFIFKQEDVDEFLKNTDPVGKVKPVYETPQRYCPSEDNAAYEKGFIDGMQKQMQSSVDRFVNSTPQTKPLSDDWFDCIPKVSRNLVDNGDGTVSFKHDYKPFTKPLNDEEMK